MQALFGRKPKVPSEVNALRLAIQNIAARYAEAEEMQLEEHRDRLRLLGSIRDDAIRITQEVNRRMVERYNRRIKPYVFKKGEERNPGRIGRLFNCNGRCFFIWREAPKPKCLPG